MTKSDSNKRSYAQGTGGGVTLTVLKLLHGGMYAKQIADRLNCSKVSVHRHIEKLVKMGLLVEEVRSFSKIYAITDKGENAIKGKKLPCNSCISTRTKLGIHLRVKIPMLKRGRLESWDNINTRFRNSVIKHKDLAHYIDGVSVRETSGAIELSIKHRKLPTFKEVMPIIFNSVYWAIGFFSAHGYKLDHLNFCINDNHNTIWTKEIGEVAESAGRTEVVFPWDRFKFTPRDPSQPSKAWFDRTPEPNLETNDRDYAVAYLQMPVTVTQIMNLMEMQNRNMETYGRHLNAHIPVLNGMEKLLKKMDRKMSEKNLNDFLEKKEPAKERGEDRSALGNVISGLAGLIGAKEGKATQVEVTEDTGDFVGLLPTGDTHTFNLRKGARIWLEKTTANALIMNGKGRLV